MNDKITTFLNSDLLNKYLIGQTTASETLEVEHYISIYPEIEKAYDTLQDKLEFTAQLTTVKAPKLILDNVLNALDEKPVIALKPKRTKKWYSLAIAASVTALLFASSSFYLFNQNKQLSSENQTIADEIFDLRGDIANNNSTLNLLLDQFKQLNNPETEKYILKGNTRAKNLKTVAYINPEDKKSMIDVVSLPQLPDNKVYQIWAELQGKMVNLGVLSEADRRLQEIPYTEDALGLSISIEPKGGSQVRSNDTPVAEISLKIGD
ncbi:anti-sigma factor domain-containing protein [Olleya sp. HaHaR_3_96]|uniref:anti-sigma factor n=1 Tax=Olleya sp. HaHaR_3_96 TaxID=2745560 RepID=UPI001C4E627D|nr:anti-sigma factor [Olleya sp. HaHaR_3_96]QXP61380.1 anti-sigma factor [Olleya sp. HaHaR_3_96]